MQNLKFRKDTKWEDIISVVREIVSNPLKLKVNGGRVVNIYNFNTYDIDIKSMLEFLQENDYTNVVIPHNMSCAWGYMFNIVRDLISEKFILVNYWKSPTKYLEVFPVDMSDYIFIKGN